nr:hypothetical protein [Tanacetum cinerariifolium]
MPPGSLPYHPPPPPPPAGPSGASGASGASRSSQVPPPPPPLPLSTNQDSPSKGSAAPSSSKTTASAEYQAWTTTDVRLRLSISLSPADLEIDEDMGPDEQSQVSDDEDIGGAHILKTGDMATFIDWFCKRRDIIELKPQDLEGLTFEIIKVFHPDVIHLQYQMKECHKLLTDSVDDPILRNNVSKPLPLGGLPGQVTIQSKFFFNKDLEYLRYGSKGSRPALSILKMKAAYYPDARLEQLVPDQFWINEECKYDIAAMYGISHWWFQRQRFYINRHTSEGDRSAVRTHMRISNFDAHIEGEQKVNNVSKPLPLGGPPGEVAIQSDFFFNKDLEYLRYGSKGSRPALSISKMKAAYYPDAGLERMVPDQFWIDEDGFEDLYLLNLQGHLNHLPPKDKKILTTAVNQWTTQLVIRQRVEDFQLRIESYQTQLNLTKPQWDAMGFEYKHDYTVIDSPRAVIFQDKYEMMMRFNEIHKFSDSTLQQIDEALDYRVKEFRINMMNPGLKMRFWTRKDVDWCKAFMFAIQRHLRTRGIFCNLESFVGGCVREGDYRLLKRTE